MFFVFLQKTRIEIEESKVIDGVRMKQELDFWATTSLVVGSMLGEWGNEFDVTLLWHYRRELVS